MSTAEVDWYAVEDAAEYVGHVFDRATEGRAHVGFGVHPYRDDAGKYQHRRWVARSFAWPAQEREVLCAIGEAAAAGMDVYLCPYILAGEKREKGSAVSRQLVHADIDGVVPVDRVHALAGAFAVASGTAGHGHVYVRLSEPISLEQHRELCRALGAYLGHADAKIVDNDVLRPPGTLNQKSAVDGGKATPVRWLREPTGARMSAQELADALDITLGVQQPSQAKSGATGKRGARPAPSPSEQVDVAGLPKRVREALANDTGDRSADTMRVVGACYDSGLSLEQTRSVVDDRDDLAERLAGRTDDDVAECWEKVETDRTNTILGIPVVPYTQEPDGGSTSSSSSSSAPAPEPQEPQEPQDGAELLDDVRALLARFVAFPDEHCLTAATLWCVHTHAIAAFDTTPRIALLSPEPGSGKTRALEIFELLVLRPLLTVNVTPAYLFRKVADAQGPPTLLYDEIDTVFGPRAKDNEDIRGMLNAGYRRGATAGRCVIKGSVEVEELPAYAAVALAGLDDLPDTIMSRSIVIRMRRRAPSERVDSYRRRTHQAIGHVLRDRIAAWVLQAWDDIDDAWPDLPDGIEDRNADVWEPLLALADAAGSHWPETARRSAVALVTAAAAKEGGLGVRLLADMRTVFDATGADRMPTDVVLTALCELDESPWETCAGRPSTLGTWRAGSAGTTCTRSRSGFPSTTRAATSGPTCSTPGCATCPRCRM